MSVNFWVSFVSALVLFGLALAALNLHKSELIRHFLARRLRRRIVPMVQTMLPLIVSYASSPSSVDSSPSSEDYRLMRYRADLETIYQQTHPLFDQERLAIAEFLSSLSMLASQFDQFGMARPNIENTVLLGERIVQELTEIGL